MRKVFVRSAYNYDAPAVSRETGYDFTDPEGGSGQTKQEFTEECDINTIVRRFNVTGQLPENVRMPTYGDFTGLRDFQEAANAIAEANESFDAMPAEVRRRFDNDPAKFVDFCSDGKNLDEARRLGLVPPLEVVPPSGSPGGPVPAAAAAGGSAGAAASASGGAPPAPAVPAALAASNTLPT